MSNTAIEYRAPARVRSTAQRAADGVVAGYIRALASAAAESSDEPPMQHASAPSARECEASWADRGPSRAGRPGRGAAVSGRRQIARRRMLVPA